MLAPYEVDRPPAQLPPDVPALAGRGAELRQLDQALAAARRGGGTAVVISAISGTAGVGKTALAVHWAHRVRDFFPDGQLYVNLRGFDPGGAAVEPADAVRGFLDALGVPAQRVPVDLAAQVGLYRSLVADRRVLVLLDNARDADQVRPLLPGSPGCFALVTSRSQLAGLVASEGAQPLTVDLLSVPQARQLLAARLGPHRLDAEPDAVDEIVVRCARLPLALAIVAARAATHPTFRLATLAAELRDARGRLDALAGDDPATDVRAVFSWSYRTLSPAAARLFRLLGPHPGPDIGTEAAASLAGDPVPRARRLLAELTRAQLVQEQVPGRFTCHDLLRAYATELAATDETARQRRAAIRRVLDHYVHTAQRAALLLRPHRDPITPVPAEPGVTRTELTGEHQASAWFAANRPVLLAAVHRSADGLDAHRWQLAWALLDVLDRRGDWHHLVATQRAALEAGERLADPVARAHAHRGLGLAYTRLDRPSQATEHLRAALTEFTRLGDRTGQAYVHLGLAFVLVRQGRTDVALGHAEEAIDHYAAGENRAGLARALNLVGWCHTLLGRHENAIRACERALDLLRESGDRYGEAATWDSLGVAHHHLAAYDRAVACFERALELFAELDGRHDEAETLAHLGDTRHAAGDVEAARRAWQRAADMFAELGHPEADRVRARLDRPPVARPVVTRVS